MPYLGSNGDVLWYCETVKNITVAVPDEIYHRSRVKAAERRTSVSALVREFLTDLADGKSDFEKGRRLHAQTLAGIRRFRASERLTRDQVHDRNAVR